MDGVAPIIELKNASKRFAGVEALSDVSLALHRGEVLCLLGDNGAGKSTLVKIMSGVHQPSDGQLVIDGLSVRLASPRSARALGVATVHQSGGTIPLLSVSRNFFLGAEPTKGRGPLRRLDSELADRICLEHLEGLGLRRVRDASQLAGSLSGGERQGLSIARAMYFGARALILDEPTSALGVKEAAIVLKLMARARERGVGVVFITHNAHHALSIGDKFVVLIQGRVAAAFDRGEKSRDEVIGLMAGGEELEELALEMADESRNDRRRTNEYT